MSCRERIRRFFGIEEDPKTQWDYAQPSDIVFMDLTGTEEAQGLGLEPGYYVAFHGVSAKAANDPVYLERFWATLSGVTEKIAPKRERGAYIPLGNKGCIVDLNNQWKFIPAIHDGAKRLWLIRAERMSPEEAAELFTPLINKHRNKFR